jgi:hypothetical protein
MVTIRRSARPQRPDVWPLPDERRDGSLNPVGVLRSLSPLSQQDLPLPGIEDRQLAGAGAEHAAPAQALVDAGATTKPAAVVALILSAHAEGTALNRIASDMGIHHKTVSKIIGGTLSRCDGHRATKDDPRNPPRARPLGLRDD